MTYPAKEIAHISDFTPAEYIISQPQVSTVPRNYRGDSVDNDKDQTDFDKLEPTRFNDS